MYCPLQGPLKYHPEAKAGSRWLRLLAMVALFAGVLIPAGALAQYKIRHKLRSPGLVAEVRPYYGFTLDHHIEMTPFRRHYMAYEFSIMKATYGRTRWEYMYNYPFIGLAYWYSSLGNAKPLGNAHAIFPYISFPLLRSRDFNLYFRLGAGIGYLTKKYHRYDNYENLAIGSNINGAINLLVEARWRLGKRFMAAGGVSLVHFSNGAIKQPNYGLNMPGVNLALAYRLSRENPYLRQKLMPRLEPFEFDGKKFLQLDVNLAVGVKDYQATLGNGASYGVVTLHGHLLWPVKFKSRMGFGVDLSYDGSDDKLLGLKGISPESKIDLVRTGINGAYELYFSRMAIMLNLGVYLTGLDKSDGYIYEKVALRFGITDHLFASVMLRAHYAKADFVSLGMGYRIPLKYY